MICPNCGAPMRANENEASFRCEYCQGVYTPEPNDEGVRLLGEPSKLDCPVCGVPLETADLAGHRILSCAKCQGLLVPMGDFVALLEQLRTDRSGGGAIQPAPDRKALDRHTQCPQCHKPMDTHFYEGPGNIIIDDCSRCFLNWLDKGELTRIVRAPNHFYAEDQYGRK